MTPIIPAHFASDFSPYLYEFVAYKRRCGFKYNGEVKELQRLDKFFQSNSQSPGNCSDDLFYGWLSKRECESDKTFTTRNSVYRQFYNYLSMENSNLVIPRPPEAREKIHSSGFTPYIFTHDEIKRLFNASDNEPSGSESFKRCAPLLFRLLYSTGLRINEALSLRVGDVLSEEGLLIILTSKNDDSRLVPLSSGLLKRITEYLSVVNYTDDEPLFQTSVGNSLSSHQVYEWFRLILWRVGIPHRGRGKGPRLHDLRHTFAVHSLQAAVEKGTDPNAFLPLISVYLGHKRLSATERYLRLTAEVYPYLTNEMNKIMNDIIPEVYDYEER